MNVTTIVHSICHNKPVWDAKEKNVSDLDELPLQNISNTVPMKCLALRKQETTVDYTAWHWFQLAINTHLTAQLSVKSSLYGQE